LSLPATLRSRWIASSFLALLLAALSGCASYISNVGPSTAVVEDSSGSAGPDASVIQLVTVDENVARRLLAQRTQRLFSETLGSAAGTATVMGPGDAIEINIWEAPPATLFASGLSSDLRGSTTGSRVVTLPEQIIDRDGFVNVPFAGKVAASGRSISDLELEVARRLKGKANQPEVLVRRVRNASATVTVVGEVANSVKLPLTPIGERLLDAIAAAGGVRQPVNKMTIQITRGTSFYTLPLQTVIRDPRQNVPLQAGDVVTAIFQSLSFTALGSTNKNEEINFEAQGITLAQALARAGGLNDARSDARGLFIFRFEPLAALDWPHQPVAATAEGLVPVIYSVDLRNPNSFFVMQSFAINDKDVLYVSNAPAAELQKFLNLILSVAYPVLTGIQLFK
jgi:polysaccharide biosynthesis/export protein